MDSINISSDHACNFEKKAFNSWNCGSAAFPPLFLLVLGSEHRALHMLGKNSRTESHLQPLWHFLKDLSTVFSFKWNAGRGHSDYAVTHVPVHWGKLVRGKECGHHGMREITYTRHKFTSQRTAWGWTSVPKTLCKSTPLKKRRFKLTRAASWQREKYYLPCVQS